MTACFRLSTAFHCILTVFIWAAAWQNQQNHTCAQRTLRLFCTSMQSDQSLHFAHWVATDPTYLHADSEYSDQTERIQRLIWVFADRTSNFVCFVMLRLILWFKERMSETNCSLSMPFRSSLYLESKLIHFEHILHGTHCMTVQNITYHFTVPWPTCLHADMIKYDFQMLCHAS